MHSMLCHFSVLFSHKYNCMIFVLQLKSPAGEPPRFYVGIGSNAPTGDGSADALIAAQFAGKGADCTRRYPPTHVVELHPGARSELAMTTRRLIELHGADCVFCAVPPSKVSLTSTSQETLKASPKASPKAPPKAPPKASPKSYLKNARSRRRWVDLSAANEARISPISHESRHFTF